jgi:hypothetical protein
MNAGEVSFWPILLPVIVGGLLAVLGGAVGPFISNFLTARNAERSKRLERFEAMFTSIYTHDHWLDNKRNVIAFGEKIDLGPPPIYTTISIAALYFPSLLDPVNALDRASDSYLLWMSQAGVKRLNGETGSIGEGMSEAFKPYRAAQLELVSALGKYAVERNGKV